MENVEDVGKSAASVWDDWKLVVQSCWEQNPDDRPSFKQLMTRLKTMYTEQAAALPPMRELGDLVHDEPLLKAARFSEAQLVSADAGRADAPATVK